VSVINVGKSVVAAVLMGTVLFGSLNAMAKEQGFLDEKNRGNFLLSQEKPVDVSDFSVIKQPEHCKKPVIDFQEEAKVYNVGKASILAEFSSRESPDHKYWIVQATQKCTAVNKFDCLSEEAMKVAPSTKATVSCWKYEGLSVHQDPKGNLVFNSDIPQERSALEKALVEKRIPGVLIENGV
jgi:hypothetical protein